MCKNELDENRSSYKIYGSKQQFKERQRERPNKIKKHLCDSLINPRIIVSLSLSVCDFKLSFPILSHTHYCFRYIINSHNSFSFFLCFFMLYCSYSLVSKILILSSLRPTWFLLHLSQFARSTSTPPPFTLKSLCFIVFLFSICIYMQCYAFRLWVLWVNHDLGRDELIQLDQSCFCLSLCFLVFTVFLGLGVYGLVKFVSLIYLFII